MSMIVNRRDVDFYLDEMFDLNGLLASERYEDHDRDSITAILDLAQQIAEEAFLPCAAELDDCEPVFEDGKAITPEVLKTCLETYVQAGLPTATFDAAQGGMQLPIVVANFMQGMFQAANAPAVGYVFLTQSNAHMLQACGSQTLCDRFLAPLIEGRWFGTMCLSEPHAGSSLSDIRCMAEPVGDGTYKLSGTKMWISGGEQDVSENIVHMVLARTPSAPPGVKGISLFLVPKIRVEADGALGVPNHIALAGLNHKMGQRGTTNALLNFGEGGDCLGYLVGEENEGLKNMFHMMNEARIGVGMGATMSGLAGYLYSLDYARNRPQGRHPGHKDPNSPMLPIIEHADIRRLLMEQKVAVEGSLALLTYCSQLVDQQLTSEDSQTSKRITLLLELLTPIAKSWPSEYTLEANKHAIQILGGYGYTREYPVERLYRDNRLNPIHEGSHGIHGLDLLGRKVNLAGGVTVAIFEEEMQPALDAASGNEGLAEMGESLYDIWHLVKRTIETVNQEPDTVTRLSSATPFLDAFGHVVIAWLWLRQALIAQQALQSGAQADADFYEGKVAACQFFYRYHLPQAAEKLRYVGSQDRSVLDAQASWFTGA
ncbi:acyl-CoA dehydrogenase [Luminiphilus sp.]|jgi:butyryl-CoA dehydrogenase|nr:acyl-CoA dehydrogenase [Luminiphilus sp.]MDB2688472.1 acyl-CoA dehydrogenase [Luminiphilus sp.]